MNKKLTVLTVALFFLFAVPSVSAQFSGGDGSESNPYEIDNEQDWIELSQNTGTYSGNYFVLTSDLEFQGGDYNIRSSTGPVSSLYINGQYHSISGVSSDRSMFSVNDGKIENIILRNNTVTAHVLYTGGNPGFFWENIEITDNKIISSGGQSGVFGGGSTDAGFSNISVTDLTLNSSSGSNPVYCFGSLENQLGVTRSDIYFNGCYIEEGSSYDEALFGYSTNMYNGYITNVDSAITSVGSSFGSSDVGNVYVNNETTSLSGGGLTERTTEQMTGTNAEQFMNLDYTNTWAITDSYPILRSLTPKPSINSFEYNPEVFGVGDNVSIDANVTHPAGVSYVNYTLETDSEIIFENRQINEISNGTYSVSFNVEDYNTFYNATIYAQSSVGTSRTESISQFVGDNPPQIENITLDPGDPTYLDNPDVSAEITDMETDVANASVVVYRNGTAVTGNLSMNEISGNIWRETNTYEIDTREVDWSYRVYATDTEGNTGFEERTLFVPDLRPILDEVTVQRNFFKYGEGSWNNAVRLLIFGAMIVFATIVAFKSG